MQHAFQRPNCYGICYTFSDPWQVFEEKLAAEKKKLAEKQKALPWLLRMISVCFMPFMYVCIYIYIYAVRSGSVHLSSGDEQVPSRQRRNAWSMSWSQRRLATVEVQKNSDSCNVNILCPTNKSSKTFIDVFLRLLGIWVHLLLIGWVLRQKELGTECNWLRLGMIGIVYASEFECLRVWASFVRSNWGNLRTRFWSWRQVFWVLVVLWFGEMR